MKAKPKRKRHPPLTVANYSLLAVYMAAEKKVPRIDDVARLSPVDKVHAIELLVGLSSPVDLARLYDDLTPERARFKARCLARDLREIAEHIASRWGRSAATSMRERYVIENAAQAVACCPRTDIMREITDKNGNVVGTIILRKGDRVAQGRDADELRPGG